MLFGDPKWGNGCLALLGGVAGLYLFGAVFNHFKWSLPEPVGSLVGLLLLLGIARFILNQIFD